MTEVIEEKTASFKVEEILRYTMFTKGEIFLSTGDVPDNAIMAQGVTRMYGFHPERLEEKRPEIIALIEEIVTDGFLIDKGGGQSFLNLCVDREGAQWTGFHLVMEAFLCLAIGLGLAGFVAPYEMWKMFPQGMPYIWFRTSAEQEVTVIPIDNDEPPKPRLLGQHE
jgi:hypothetical protein